MRSHILASDSILKEGSEAETVCGKKLAHVSFGSMDDLRSFREIQEAVSCYRCKKAEDPMKRFVYGGSEGQEAMTSVREEA